MWVAISVVGLSCHVNQDRDTDFGFLSFININDVRTFFEK
jgi:hypothetical protein